MRNSIKVILLSIVFLFLFLGYLILSTPPSLEEIISKSIPLNDFTIVHIEQITDGAIIFFLTPSGNHHLIGVAFFKEDDNRGWENIGSLGLSDYNSDYISFNVESVNFHQESPHNDRVQVIFGQIYNDKINKVRVGNSDDFFVDAQIVNTSEGRFYFEVGKYNLVQGFNQDNEKIIQLGQ